MSRQVLLEMALTGFGKYSSDTVSFRLYVACPFFLCATVVVCQKRDTLGVNVLISPSAIHLVSAAEWRQRTVRSGTLGSAKAVKFKTVNYRIGTLRNSQRGFFFFFSAPPTR